MNIKLTKKNLIIFITILLVVITSTSFAWFFVGDKEENVISFTSGCLNVTITQESDSINLTSATPIKDVEGLLLEPYTFTIKNNCSTSTYYHINLESINTNEEKLNNDNIRIAINGDNFDNIIRTLSEAQKEPNQMENTYEAYNLYAGFINGQEEKNFEVRIWLNHAATSEAQSKIYKSKINVLTNPEFVTTELPEIKTKLSGGSMKGTLTKDVSDVKYCFTQEDECEPQNPTSVDNKAISVKWEPQVEYQMLCTKINSENEIYCSKPYNDIEPPTDPTIRLQNDTLYFENSTDNLGEVTYHYSLGCGENLDDYTLGTSVSTNQSSSICVYAEDAAGNRSQNVQKQLTVIASQTESAPAKYYCSRSSSYYDSYQSAVSACTYSASYTCYSGYLSGSVCIQSAWVESGSTSCNCQSIPYDCTTTQTCRPLTEDELEACYHSCVDCELGSCPGGDHSTQCGDACEVAQKCFDNQQCNYREECQTCPYTNYYCASGWSRYSGSGSSLVCSQSASYYCPSGGSQSGSSCYVSVSSSPTYYCRLTGRYYNSQSEASSACTNYCSSGTYYSGRCYKLD